MLEIRQVRKSYGAVQALDRLDLTVEHGEVAGLIGHNGAGKSTLVGVISGLVTPDAGQVVVDGIDVRQEPKRARARLGIAPQDEALYLPMTVREHLRLFATLGGLRGAAVRHAVDRTAEEMALTEVLDRRIGVLSGGQRRRTQTATALVHSPPVLLLDEPTVGADPQTRQALLAAVRARADDGAAVLYTTHYLPELHDLDATVAVLIAGRLAGRGRRQDMLAGLPGTLQLTVREPVELLDLDVDIKIDGTEIAIRAPEPGRLLVQLLPDLADQLTDVHLAEPALDDLAESLQQHGF